MGLYFDCNDLINCYVTPTGLSQISEYLQVGFLKAQ
jgi:hypothetical protein